MEQFLTFFFNTVKYSKQNKIPWNEIFNFIYFIISAIINTSLGIDQPFIMFKKIYITIRKLPKNKTSLSPYLLPRKSNRIFEKSKEYNCDPYHGHEPCRIISTH